MRFLCSGLGLSGLALLAGCCCGQSCAPPATYGPTAGYTVPPTLTAPPAGAAGMPQTTYPTTTLPAGSAPGGTIITQPPAAAGS